MIKFEWDKAKTKSNIKKHGVAFEEAKSVFFDEYAIQFYDDESSQLEEDRFLMLGTSNEANVLLVCLCERQEGEIIRIISARKATNLNVNIMRVANMRDEYDFSKMKSRKNPYASKLKKPVTIRLSEDVVAYFKEMSEENGVPYQSLINLYLRDCVAQHRTLDLTWNKRP